FRRQSIKVQIQGAQILSDDSYLAYFEETKNAAQHRIWTFYEAVNDKFLAPTIAKKIKLSIFKLRKSFFQAF
ncbi:MAG: hypothetical protein J7K96_13785, partial [Desulfobacteraceae bacterium]|nr:hypothetical protein [Desulfobacteraceae bacterium]